MSKFLMSFDRKKSKLRSFTFRRLRAGPTVPVLSSAVGVEAEFGLPCSVAGCGRCLHGIGRSS